MNLYLPPYLPFLNPIEEFFSSWRWKVYDRQPYTRVNLLQAMDLACGDIGEESCQGWIRHTLIASGGTILLVMSTNCSGLTQAKDKNHIDHMFTPFICVHLSIVYCSTEHCCRLYNEKI